MVLLNTLVHGSAHFGYVFESSWQECVFSNLASIQKSEYLFWPLTIICVILYSRPHLLYLIDPILAKYIFVPFLGCLKSITAVQELQISGDRVEDLKKKIQEARTLIESNKNAVEAEVDRQAKAQWAISLCNTRVSSYCGKSITCIYLFLSSI